jgi:RNA polymerase sigma factor (sigma-70 family)
MSPHSAALLHQLRQLACPPPDAELLRRWSGSRDEDAFAALVARHGRMVLGVCRRILGNGHDAEDVFQATFLVLARKASSLRRPEALAGRLHGVALRLAHKARTAAARRRAAAMAEAVPEPLDPHPEPLDLLSARELLALIDREVARLPEVYRLPLVLCDLEERAQGEAAHLLGWTAGSLRGRLLRGRERLKARLARRGLAPAVLPALLASGLTRGQADAALAPLVVRMSELAVRFGSGPAAAQVSPAVAALAREGLRGEMLARLKLVSALLLIATTLAAGTGMLAGHVRAPLAASERGESAAASPSPDVPDVPTGDRSRDRRDSTGDPLPESAIARLGTTRFRHGGRVEGLRFTADGKSLVSCGEGLLRVWDAATGREVRRFPQQTTARFIALSPDAKLFAVQRHQNGPQEGPIEIHDFASGRLLRQFGKETGLGELLFSPDGSVLASYRWRQDIELWDPVAGKLLHTLMGHQDIVWSVAFSADGKTLVSASDDRTIRFWDVARGKEVRRISHREHGYLVALSPDGKLVASVDATKEVWKDGGGTSWHPHNRVRLWDAATGKELRQLTPPPRVPAPRISDRLMALAFSPDGKTLVTGGLDGVLRFWDLATGRPLRQVPGFVGSPTALTFAPDGKTLALGDALTVRRIDVRTGKDLLRWPGHSSVPSSLSVSPDGKTAATVSYHGPIRLWDTRTGRPLPQRLAVADDSHGRVLLPDGRTYSVIGPDQVLRFHDLATGKELAEVPDHDPPLPFALSPDRKLLASVGKANVLRLLDVTTGKTAHTLSAGGGVIQGMAFAANSRTLAAWTGDRVVTVWDAARGKELRQFAVPPVEGAPLPPNQVAYLAALSPDGRLMAFALQIHGPRSGTLLVVDAATGKEIRCFAMTASAASSLTFSPDSKSLAWSDSVVSSESGRGRIHLGEIATGHRRHSFPGHAAGVTALVFSADGKTLLSAAEDTTALVWELTGRLGAGAKVSKPLSGDGLKAHWAALAGEDATAAYRAIQALADDPRHALPFLEQQLRPVRVSAGDEDRIKRWIADLDNNDFDEREKASRELDRQGEAALPAVRKALANEPSVEVRRRLEQLLRKYERSDWSLTSEQVRGSRALEVLERIGTAEACRLLEALAAGMPEAWLTRQAQAARDRLTK